MAVERTVGIALEGVTKRYGKAEAVKDVSLAIGEGEFFSLLGPSGCGKTTTLRVIAGFEVPDEGRVLLQGQDVTRVTSNRRCVMNPIGGLDSSSGGESTTSDRRESRRPRAHRIRRPR